MNKYMKRELTVNTVVFMAVNLLLGLFSAVSMLVTNTSLTAEDMLMTPETFASYGMGNVELGEVIYLCIYIAMFAIPIAASVLINHKEQMNEYISFKRPELWLTVGGIFGVYAINYACYICSAAGEMLFASAAVSKAADNFTPIQAVIFCIIIAIAPAFLEEFTFRGVILGRLKKYNKTVALLASSILFSVMHLNLQQIPFAFFAGLLMGYIYLRTQSIWSVIIIHGANNLLAFAETLFSQYASDEEYAFALFTCIFAGLFVIGFVCLIVIALTGKKAESKNLIGNKCAFKYMLLNPVFIVCVIMCLFVAFTYAGVFTV